MNQISQQVEKLPTIKTIAVIGLSDNPKRYSYEVCSYLQKRGIRIIPVNPNITESLGEKAYKSLLDIPLETTIDVVLMYRKSEEVMTHVAEVIKRGGIPTIWLPEGVENAEAEQVAKDHGITIVSNFCIMKESKKTEEKN